MRCCVSSKLWCMQKKNFAGPAFAGAGAGAGAACGGNHDMPERNAYQAKYEQTLPVSSRQNLEVLGLVGCKSV